MAVMENTTSGTAALEDEQAARALARLGWINPADHCAETNCGN